MKNIVDKMIKKNGIDKTEFKIITFVSIVFLISLGILKFNYSQDIIVEISSSIGFSIVTGILSGYIVSYYFEQRNKKQGLKEDIEYIINSLGVLKSLIGDSNEESKKNHKDIFTIIQNWKLKLKSLKDYFEYNKYSEEDIEMINRVVKTLVRIENNSKKPKNDYIDITNWDIRSIWMNLNKIRNSIK